MNILYIGSSGALSLVPFNKLLASDYTVKAVGIYRPIVLDAKIIALENESLALAARQQNITLINLSISVEAILQQIIALSIDVILMACYGKHLPIEIIQCLHQSCFNLHPSLLPACRGPEPIFWQMQQAANMGISWHQVSAEFDAGDIVLQKKVFFDDGLNYQAINLQLAESGAELMLQLLSDYAAGTLVFMPQNTHQASYYPYPDKNDFVVKTSGSARHAYNFMRATAAFGFAYTCATSWGNITLTEALDFDNNACSDSIKVKADHLYIPFKAGVLKAAFTGKLPL